MKRFVEGVDRGQCIMFPERLEDRVRDDNRVRAVGVFVNALDLGGSRFVRVALRATKTCRLKDALLRMNESRSSRSSQ